MTVEYDNGWIVVQSGLLRAGLTPYAGQLKFQFVDFLVTDHESYVAKSKMRRGIAEQTLSEDLVAEIRGLPKSGRRDGKKDKRDKEEGPTASRPSGEESSTAEEKPNVGKREEARFTVPVERWSMPENPVNEYGMTLRAMRCLEITESVCQLRGLMDYASTHSLGPMDALHRLAEEFRASKGGKVGGSGDQISPTGSQSGSASGDGSSGKRKLTRSGSDPTKIEDADEAANETSSPNKRPK